MKDEYIYNEVDYEYNNNNNNESEEITDEEFLDILNDEMDKVDKFVDILWENVILRYIESNKTVLSKLTVLDKHKFKKYIIENSKICESILLEIKNIKSDIEYNKTTSNIETNDSGTDK